MKLKRTLLIGIAVVAVAALAGQAGATSRSAIKLSGTYAVHGESGKTDCNPISQANPAVLTCTVSGFTLDYTGSLTGQGVNDFRWIVDCSTGKSYTARSDAWSSRSCMSATALSVVSGRGCQAHRDPRERVGHQHKRSLGDATGSARTGRPARALAAKRRLAPQRSRLRKRLGQRDRLPHTRFGEQAATAASESHMLDARSGSTCRHCQTPDGTGALAATMPTTRWQAGRGSNACLQGLDLVLPCGDYGMPMIVKA
jgi:hypothetical protein